MDALQQIRDKRADLARQRTAIEKQDEELAIAERVLTQFQAEADFKNINGASFEAKIATTPQAPFLFVGEAQSVSRREKVVEALSGEKVWMTSSEINLAIAARHRALLKTNSLFPMLTNLKKEGVIVRDGDKMALKGRIEGGANVMTG